VVTNSAESTESTHERTEQAEKAVRVVVGGHPQASVRRIILWVLLLVFIVGGQLPLAIGTAGLLALTDDLL